MHPAQFRDFIRYLRNAYGLTMYRGKNGEDSEVMDFLYDRVGNIPHESVAWIQERFLQTHEKFPTKLHTAIAWLYQDWLKNNPKKRDFSEFVKRACKHKECDEGLLHLWGEDQESKQKYEYCFRCQDCGRSTLRGIPEGVLSDLLQRGFSLSPPEFDRSLGEQFKKAKGKATMSIDEIASLAKEMMVQRGW